MFRSKLLLILLSGALVFAACSDSATDNGDNGDNGDDPVEPTVSVNNPSDGATLEGEVTVSIDGNSENGFDEARIFVGDEQVETVSDPSLPVDQTIDTRNYNNGDYDLSAELDATDQDTTVEASVSVTLANYLLEIDTNGRISQLKDQSGLEDELLFVADPDGNVLKKVDLLNQSDGTLQLLPPSELPEDGAPDHFTLTQLSNAPDDNGNPSMFIITDVGFQPWTDIVSEDISGGDDSSAPDSTDITMELNNVPDGYFRFQFVSPDIVYDNQQLTSQNSFQGTRTFLKDTENLIMTTYRGEQGTPLFYWEQDLQNGETLTFDVGNDFNSMTAHKVDWPTDFDFNSSYSYSVSIDQNSFDSGTVGTLGFSNEISSGQNNMYVPNTDHQYITTFSGLDQDGNDLIQHTHVREGDLPGSFSRLDHTVTHDNTSMDDVQLSVSGSANPDFVFHNRSSENGHTWLAILPPDTTQFVFPKIADSLSQRLSSSYDRSTFKPVLTTTHDIPDVDGFDAYFDDYFVLSNGLFSFTRHQKMRIHDFFQSRHGKQKIQDLQHVESTQRGVVPVLQTDKWGNRYSPLLESLNK